MSANRDQSDEDGGSQRPTKAQELLERVEAHEEVAALLVADRRRRPVGVVVAGVEHGVVGKLPQRVQAVVELRRVAAGQIGPTAAADEERVAGDQVPVDEEALRAGRVAGRVHEGERDLADLDGVAGVDRDDVATARDPTRARRTPPRAC
jgi:hypothetical protein